MITGAVLSMVKRSVLPRSVWLPAMSVTPTENEYSASSSKTTVQRFMLSSDTPALLPLSHRDILGDPERWKLTPEGSKFLS